jgi:hypothetical protein
MRPIRRPKEIEIQNSHKERIRAVYRAQLFKDKEAHYVKLQDAQENKETNCCRVM